MATPTPDCIGEIANAQGDFVRCRLSIGRDPRSAPVNPERSGMSALRKLIRRWLGINNPAPYDRMAALKQHHHLCHQLKRGADAAR